MESDYKIILKVGKYFIGKRYELNSTPKYKHRYYFLGKSDMGSYKEILIF